LQPGAADRARVHGGVAGALRFRGRVPAEASDVPCQDAAAAQAPLRHAPRCRGVEPSPARAHRRDPVVQEQERLYSTYKHVPWSCTLDLDSWLRINYVPLNLLFLAIIFFIVLLLLFENSKSFYFGE
jgi:hypothetical protein